MNLSSPPSAPSGFISEPPLSPGAAPTARPVASVTPPTPPTPPTPATPSIEAQVVRMGLMTPDEVATTMREEAETGRSFAELAVEHGRVRAEDLALLTESPAAEPARTPPPLAVVPEPQLEAGVEAGVEPEPELVAEPEPIAEVVPEPEAEPESELAPEPELEHAARTRAEVFVMLTSGERIAVGSYGGQDEAEQRARELMDALDTNGEWPRFEGRFVRPDAVVSIDVELGDS